ncbi:MAG TPA: CRISPR-associated endonuclease Cas1 [Firmicutes bacterium]|nr:CRISPR-associated endonuclease Cas1 [Bacillota bacterium]
MLSANNDKSPLYITEQGASIKKRSDALIIEKNGDVLLEIECMKIDSIMLFGNIQFSTQVMRELFQHGIEFALFSSRGNYLGRLSPELSNNAELRLRHHERLFQPDFQLRFAAELVRAKIDNSLITIDRSLESKRQTQSDSLQKARDDWNRKIESCKSLDSLRGLEGSFARMYFDQFASLIPAPFAWHGRIMHPAPDPVNALLSLTYTFITNRLHSLIEGIGLDPYLGFLHVADYSRPSLALDILEPFRAPLCDRFVLTLLAWKSFKPSDFEIDTDGGCRLNKDEFNKYIASFEKEMNRNIRSGDLDTSWNLILRDSVWNLKHIILGNQPAEFFRMPLR